MIQIHQIRVRCSVCNHDRHFIQNEETPAKRSGRTHRHQCVHIRCAGKQGLKSAREEFLIDDHDNQSQTHLCQSETDMIMFKK